MSEPQQPPRPVAPPLVISMGAPSGIGPEVTGVAWQALCRSGPCFLVVGDPALYAQHPVQEIERPDQAHEVFPTALPVLRSCDLGPVAPGRPDERHSHATLQAIETSVALVAQGQASGLVTAPIAKAPLIAAGFAHPGHTEFLGTLTASIPHAGTRGPVMMLAIKGLRVVPVTIHCALGQVAHVLTTESILHALQVTHEALLLDFGIKAPRLAVAGLNPHAGEGGAFGDEEARIIAPAIAHARALGFDVTGPWPADTLFHEEARARVDAVICMYHDQALIPLKTLDFWGGVNVTLGLPIIRTSPDHGTGFDIAGRGIARADSMIAAIRLAADVAQNRAGLR
jgi:4-hydroxythreonine-4-phosphate dehydrogenase